MNPAKVDRSRLAHLEDLPNFGKAMAGDLRLIGIHVPGDLAGRNPLDLYDALCSATDTRQDPCVLDVLLSVVRFMDGGPARSWWMFSAERKRFLEGGAGGA